MTYSPDYESQLIRGIEDPRPWDLVEEIRKFAKSTDRLLDIGCGTGVKLRSVSPLVKEVVGIEPNHSMREKALKNLEDWKLSKINIIEGTAEDLPFENEEFDMVTSMVAPHDTEEVWRVLKSGGYAIIEKIGDRDKWNVKSAFGQRTSKINPVHHNLQQTYSATDPNWRGSYSDYEPGERAQRYKKEFSNKFVDVDVRNAFWKTWYSFEGLVLLLKQVPIIRDFDEEQDSHVLEQIRNNYTSEKGIETAQNRILIIARKPHNRCR